MFAPGLNRTLQFEAADPRADGRRRMVSVSRDLIVIARSREGVAMRIALRPRAYKGVLLRLIRNFNGDLGYEVKLLHADPDLSVALALTDDEAAAERAWREWARFIGGPALVERVEGRYEEVSLGASLGPFRRRRGVGARRPRFLARRQAGRPELAVAVDSGRELFGGWRAEEL